MSSWAFEDVFPLYIKHVIKARRHEHESSPFRTATLISVQGPAAMYWDDPPQSWEWHRDLGIVSPLSRDVWLEAAPHIPMSRFRQDLTERQVAMIEAQRAAQRVTRRPADDDESRKIAIHLESFDPNERWKNRWLPDDDQRELASFLAPEAKWGYEATVYVESDRGFSSSAIPAVMVLVDGDGRYIKHARVDHREVPRPFEPHVPAEDAYNPPINLDPFVQDATMFALYTLSLAHAKNIGVVEEDSAIESKRLKKELGDTDGIPAKFSRINLQTPSVSDSPSGSPGGTPASRMHFVRGHFKTYTEDNKLMGKHVGTYFWSHHARGDQSQGEVQQIYEA